MTNLKDHLISLRRGLNRNLYSRAKALESSPFMYLASSYSRCCDERVDSQVTEGVWQLMAVLLAACVFVYVYACTRVCVCTMYMYIVYVTERYSLKGLYAYHDYTCKYLINSTTVPWGIIINVPSTCICLILVTQ